MTFCFPWQIFKGIHLVAVHVRYLLLHIYDLQNFGYHLRTPLKEGTLKVTIASTYTLILCPTSGQVQA